jgi:hypothetical protein
VTEWLWKTIVGAVLDRLAAWFRQFLDVLRAKEAGREEERKRQLEADKEAAAKRAEVEDANTKLTPDERRANLRLWVRDADGDNLHGLPPNPPDEPRHN